MKLYNARNFHVVDDVRRMEVLVRHHFWQKPKWEYWYSDNKIDHSYWYRYPDGYAPFESRIALQNLWKVSVYDKKHRTTVGITNEKNNY